MRDADVRNGVNMRYLRKLRARLTMELSRNRLALLERKLVAHLKAHDFWVRGSDAPALVANLGLEIDGFDVDYIRDVRIWIPYEQYGYQVCCPGCMSVERVSMQPLVAARQLRGVMCRVASAERTKSCQECSARARVGCVGILSRARAGLEVLTIARNLMYRLRRL